MGIRPLNPTCPSQASRVWDGGGCFGWPGRVAHARTLVIPVPVTSYRIGLSEINCLTSAIHVYLRHRNMCTSSIQVYLMLPTSPIHVHLTSPIHDPVTIGRDLHALVDKSLKINIGGEDTHSSLHKNLSPLYGFT